MSDDVECRHGMDPIGCADCRGLPELVEPDPDDSFTFTAVYRGVCIACGDSWLPGAKISRSKFGSGGYRCAACSVRVRR